MKELQDLIKEEHRRAELERLRLGEECCGCRDCQQLYSTLDLSEYGSRVIRVGGEVLMITASKNGSDSSQRKLEADKAVSKIPKHESLPSTDIRLQPAGIMKPRGRPRKADTAAVSRTTAWRRQKETQGVLL